MAVVNRSSASDFIHRLDDGFFFGGNEITMVAKSEDQIDGAAGKGMIFGDAGNDSVDGLDGNDTIVGGQGADRSLGEVGNHVFQIPGISDISKLAKTIDGGHDGGHDGGTFLFAAATGIITVNLPGGAGIVAGGDGNDVQLGGSGNDTLQGGAGQGELWGQAGTENLTGDISGDVFVFNDLSDLGMGGARDVITDFTHGQDIIRLTNTDANLNLAGDQQFIFIGGSPCGGIVGQLRYAGGV